MKYQLLLLLLFFNSTSFCQTADNTKRLNETNIYYQALTQYLRYVKTNESRSIDTIYIEDEYRLTDSLLLQSGPTKFIKLKYEDIPAFLKTNRSLTLYRLFPLKYENGEFSVSFNPYLVSYDRKKKVTNYAYSSTYKVTFKFLNDKFVFQKVEGFGI
jgi:hypothetical protein